MSSPACPTCGGFRYVDRNRAKEPCPDCSAPSPATHQGLVDDIAFCCDGNVVDGRKQHVPTCDDRR